MTWGSPGAGGDSSRLDSFSVVLRHYGSDGFRVTGFASGLAVETNILPWLHQHRVNLYIEFVVRHVFSEP